tara:strand:+ start:215 stop:427 length:213 start_codon:yes stop_codon:yes gene_type:complete
MTYSAYYDYDDFGLTNKGGGGKKNKPAKDKKNPDGKYTSKHVRVAQGKKERSAKKRIMDSKNSDSSSVKK